LNISNLVIGQKKLPLNWNMWSLRLSDKQISA